MRGAIVVCALASLAAAVSSGCIGKDPYEPGTQLGTFQVTGKLTTNTCGSGQAPDPWQFSVKLGVDPGTLYWEQGSLPVSGTLTGAHVATLTSNSTQTAVAGASGPTCILERDDALTATLTPDPTLANEYASFTGTIHYTFKQGAGSSDCSVALASNGGGYAALPCDVAYDISAARTALPNQYGK